MDFAYLRKPVIYAQFDKERLFSGEHIYQKGYFEYEQDGFGEVVNDLEALAEQIISYMQSKLTVFLHTMTGIIARGYLKR